MLLKESDSSQRLFGSSRHSFGDNNYYGVRQAAKSLKPGAHIWCVVECRRGNRCDECGRAFFLVGPRSFRICRRGGQFICAWCSRHGFAGIRQKDTVSAGEEIAFPRRIEGPGGVASLPNSVQRDADRRHPLPSSARASASRSRAKLLPCSLNLTSNSTTDWLLSILRTRSPFL